LRLCVITVRYVCVTVVVTTVRYVTFVVTPHVPTALFAFTVYVAVLFLDLPLFVVVTFAFAFYVVLTGVVVYTTVRYVVPSGDFDCYVDFGVVVVVRVVGICCC